MADIVLDTNVFVSALRSDGGASREVLRRILQGRHVPLFGNALWLEFCRRLGGKEAIYNRFFPRFIDTMSKITSETVHARRSNKWTTPVKLGAVPDSDLLAVKGVGPAKLKIICKGREQSTSKNSELVDLVER